MNTNVAYQKSKEMDSMQTRPNQPAADKAADTPTTDRIDRDEYIRSEKISENCTINTDNVDHEIEKLKEEQKQLEQEIKSASGNEEKIKALEIKLARVVNELRQKDNDNYRRQNAVIN